mmetsp:Transcript_18966/g.45096  ORF Transcript_18966/g.45096 Transcript_18966/m.45096 type:complete len:292 (+) Transcript_18966:177-1052(+)
MQLRSHHCAAAWMSPRPRSLPATHLALTCVFALAFLKGQSHTALHSTEPGVRAQLLSHQSAETELPIFRLQTFSKVTSGTDCCGLTAGTTGCAGALTPSGACSGAGCGSGAGALTPLGAGACVGSGAAGTAATGRGACSGCTCAAFHPGQWHIRAHCFVSGVSAQVSWHQEAGVASLTLLHSAFTLASEKPGQRHTLTHQAAFGSAWQVLSHQAAGASSLMLSHTPPFGAGDALASALATLAAAFAILASAAALSLAVHSHVSSHSWSCDSPPSPRKPTQLSLHQLSVESW